MPTFFSKLLQRMRRGVLSPGGPPPPPADPALAHQRDVFALRVQALLNAVGVPAEYDADQFSLRMDRGSERRRAHLENQFYEYAAAPAEDRERVLLHVAQGIRDACAASPIPVMVNDARRALRPRIRHRAQQSIVRLQQKGVPDAGEPSTDGVFVSISTDLGAEVVFDTPTNIVSLSSEQLEQWGISAEEALALAVHNLRTAAPEPFRPVGEGVYVATVGDCYDSARILLTDEIARLPLRGSPVALPANRDTLMITGSRQLGGLYRILEVALQTIERPRMDTLQPVVLTHGVWRDWLPAADHPMWDAFYELSVITRGECYAAVRRVVEDQLVREGRDVFVASYGVLVRQEGDLPWSHAVWPPVAGWLPEADLVTVIHPHGERYIVVPWPKLRQAAHHLMRKVPEVHPPYFSFDGAPDRELWERLRVHAVREGVVRERARAAVGR